MDLENFDKIHVQNLRCRCVLGVYPEERLKPREILVNLTIYFDAQDVSKTDDIGLAIDYDVESKRILAHVENTQYRLIETLAESIAAILLENSAIPACRVRLIKTGVPDCADSTSVEIIRRRRAEGYPYSRHHSIL